MTEIKQVSTRLPMDLYRKVKVKAAQTDKTMTQVLREALEEWVSDDPNEDDQKTKAAGG